MALRGFEKISKHVDNSDIILPKRSTKHSVGYDFFLPHDIQIPAGKFVTIHTGIKSFFQPDEGLFFYTRSGLGSKKGLVLRNNVAVFECDYYNNSGNEGEAIITLLNTSDEEIILKKGDKFCQAVFQKVLFGDDEVEEERKGGLGHTGN
jgi:dUTP pyrophosphatase